MPLKINTSAPDFSLSSTSGSIFKLSESAQNTPCILFFYPKDFTPGCTQEVCEFRDAFQVFRDLDILILGISQDDISTHTQFKEKHNLPFDLLADINGKVSKLYKANIPLLGMSRRVTYLLSKSHEIVAVYENLFGAEKHIKKMIEMVKS